MVLPNMIVGAKHNTNVTTTYQKEIHLLCRPEHTTGELQKGKDDVSLFVSLLGSFVSALAYLHNPATHATKPTLDPTKIVPHRTRPARYHLFGEGHEQARSAPALEQGTEPGQLPQHGEEDLQQNSEQNLQQPGLDAWRHPPSRADLVTHSMHTVPPATYTPCTQPLRQDNDFCNIHSIQNISKLSLLLGRPDTIPSGKDTGKPARSSDRCREENTDCNI